MQCRHCGKRYSANHSAPWPGGFESPGTWFFAAVVSAAVSAVLFWFDMGLWKWGALTLATIFAVLVPSAMADCRGPSGLHTTGGETCPECGGINEVKPWSL